MRRWKHFSSRNILVIPPTLSGLMTATRISFMACKCAPPGLRKKWRVPLLPQGPSCKLERSVERCSGLGKSVREERAVCQLAFAFCLLPAGEAPTRGT